MTFELLSPEQLAELERAKACPYWEKMNPTGWCVPKWWAGGVLSRLIDGVAVVAGMTVLGLIVAGASKTKVFSPAIKQMKQAQEALNFVRNPRRSRRRRRYRR